MALLGVQLGLVGPVPLQEALKTYFLLQRNHSLKACEVQLEASLYQSACWPWEKGCAGMISSLRPEVEKLGVHLPFMDINPVSANPRLAQTNVRILEEALDFAAAISADYAVMHPRGRNAKAHRNEELLLWAEVITSFTQRASKNGISFYLENADDVRDPMELELILQHCPETVKICLDIGHLYERIYPFSTLKRRALTLNDRFSPAPFIFKEGLPAAAWGSWHEALAHLRKRLGCVHIHNHNGREAHRPLSTGKIKLLNYAGVFNGLPDLLPLIIEADYRKWSLETLKDDLTKLEVQLIK